MKKKRLLSEGMTVVMMIRKIMMMVLMAVVGWYLTFTECLLQSCYNTYTQKLTQFSHSSHKAGMIIIPILYMWKPL